MVLPLERLRDYRWTLYLTTKRSHTNGHLSILTALFLHLNLLDGAGWQTDVDVSRTSPEHLNLGSLSHYSRSFFDHITTENSSNQKPARNQETASLNQS